MLGAREPQIVNGPEILDKFVGEAEKNIRALFTPAEIEYNQVGGKYLFDTNGRCTASNELVSHIPLIKRQICTSCYHPGRDGCDCKKTWKCIR